MRQQAQQRIEGHELLAAQRHQQDGNRQRHDQHAGRQVEREGKADGDADQAGLRHRLAVVGHAAPHHEAAERSGHHREPEPRQQGAHQEGLAHVRPSRPRAIPAGRRLRLARQIVPVVVVVMVEGEGAGRLRPEQARVLGMLRHRLRHARAAHMAVEADDAVALRHDDVQIVRHEQDAEAVLGAQPADQRVELGLAGIVDAAHGLVEHQDAGRADQRARQHHPLQLAARTAPRAGGRRACRRRRRPARARSPRPPRAARAARSGRR